MSSIARFRSRTGEWVIERLLFLCAVLSVFTTIGIVIVLLSLGRGLFYASVPTLLSLVAVVAMLFAVYNAIVEWTGARRYTRHWAFASFLFFALASGCAVAALPRLDHTQELLAGDRLDAAELELAALGDDAPAGQAPG